MFGFFVFHKKLLFHTLLNNITLLGMEVIELTLTKGTELDFQKIMAKIDAVLTKHQLDYEITWTFNGKPFITEPGTLVDAAVKAIKTVTNIDTELSTSGGTSDGRFIAPTGAQVIELGPCNATIHQVNESVSCDDLIALTDIYYHTLINALTDQAPTV